VTDHEFTDDVGAYLLQALASDEVSPFEAHLETCAECRREVALLRVAADALPNAAVQMTPPPDLKDRIMAVVNSEAELLQAAGARADEPIRPRERERKRRFAGLLPAAWSARPGLALAATLMILVLGGTGALLGRSALDGNDPQVTAALGKAKLIQRKGGHSTLVATGLRPPGPGRVYQVWLKRPGQDPKPTNALFGARRDGSASVDVPGSLQGVETVLVTSEPEGGSQKPTTAPVIEAHPA